MEMTVGKNESVEKRHECAVKDGRHDTAAGHKQDEIKEEEIEYWRDESEERLNRSKRTIQFCIVRNMTDFTDRIGDCNCW